MLVDQLRRHGVNTIFTVPGESFLAVLDALHDEPAIRTVVCRHESGAGIMAEAQARLRGDLGVAFVTRGPGATHASVAVHNASMSGTALLLFIGQVPTAHRGRRAFQEVDFEAFFGPLAKWSVEVDDPGRLSSVAAEAARVARDGRWHFGSNRRRLGRRRSGSRWCGPWALRRGLRTTGSPASSAASVTAASWTRCCPDGHPNSTRTRLRSFCNRMGSPRLPCWALRNASSTRTSWRGGCTATRSTRRWAQSRCST